jgi:hypothetical protein
MSMAHLSLAGGEFDGRLLPCAFQDQLAVGGWKICRLFSRYPTT